MKTIFRLFGLTLVVAIVFLAVVIGAFVALFDANAYKDDLASLVRDETGRDLQFHGDVELTVYPALGMKLGAMSLSNAAGFGAQPMVKVAAASVSVDVRSLLAMSPEIEKLVLRDLEVNLITNKVGVTNWDDLVKPTADEASAAGESGDAASGVTAGDDSLPRIEGAFGGLDLQNIRLLWLDEQAGERYEITDLDLSTGRIAPNQPFPLSLHLVVQGDVDVTVDLETGVEYLIDQQQLTLDGLKFSLNEFAIGGRVQLSDFSAPTPTLRFDLRSEELDVDALLGIPPAAPEGPAPDDGMQNDEPAEDVEIALPMELLRGLDIDGRLRIAALKAQNLKLANFDMALKAADGQVGIAPLKADGYSGRIETTVGIDVTRKNPRYAIEQSLDGVQVGELLKDFTGEDTILGTANLEASLNTRGSWLSKLRRNLNGSIEIAFLDGALNGFNLRHEIDKAKAKLRGRPAPAGETLRTDFSSLTLSGVIKKGVFKSDDLDLRAPLIRVSGSGSADLADETVDYLVSGKLVGAIEGQDGGAADDLAGLDIPVRITGPFTAPDINVLLDDMMRARVDAEKARLKAEIDAQKAQLKAEIAAEKQKLEQARQREIDKQKAALEAKRKAAEEEARRKADARKQKAEDEARKKLEDKLDNLIN